jgi:hypothetical protein
LTKRHRVPYSHVQMRPFFASLLLTACGVSTTPAPTGPDLAGAADDLQATLERSNPQPLLAWALEPHSLLDTSSGCPAVTVTEQEGGVFEQWQGDCEQPDGTQVHGSLTWFDGPDSAWTAGEQFSVEDFEGLVISLDGAVEVQGEGALWLAEANAMTCQGTACADGPMAVDLSYTIFPAEGYPLDYDVTVSGVVAESGGAIIIDGAWSIDEATCAREPINGLIAVKHGTHQTLRLDGASACDACGSWMVQGRDAPAYCGTFR